MSAFGRARLDDWLLDPGSTYLNHGTVGAPPRRVLVAQQALRDEIERQPSKFLLRELAGSMPAPWRGETRLREAARKVAAFVGARAEDLVFVPNVTTGLNVVLQSLPLGPGNEIVMTDLAYGAIAFAVASVARERGAAVRTVASPFPFSRPGQIVDVIRAALTAETRLVVIDHVTANTALILPVAEIAAACHERGVPVLVDGAHAPGSIAVDVPALGADWYSANLHKWAHAPRSSGFLWAHADRQAGLRNPVVSWGSGQGFVREFEWSATADPTPYLIAPVGLALLQEWGFEAVLRYMHELAWEGAQRLCGRWRTQLETPREMVGAMVSVPLPESVGTTEAEAARLRLSLLEDDQIEVHVHARQGRIWARVSAQIYNDLGDIDRLADAVARRMPEA